MWVHFESMHVIWQPTYTGIFHPAQGLIMGVGQAALGHPFWGVCVALLCRRHAVRRREVPSHTLAAVRGTLLPKPISGELCARDAERVVELAA